MTHAVAPAKAGVRNCLKYLDFGFRRNDEPGLQQQEKRLKLMTLTLGLIAKFREGLKAIGKSVAPNLLSRYVL